MFKSVENKKVYQQVVDQIQNMILGGRLKAGDKLPAERDMVKLFQVSRTSVREAVRALEILGLVECRQGDGNFIRKEFDTGLFEPLSIMFKLHNGNALELFKVRKMLEIEAVSLAVERVNDAQREELKSILEKLAAAGSEEEKVKFDAEFHFKIIEISDNYLLKCFYNAVSSLMKSFISDARKIFLKAEKSRKLAALHRDILEAIVSGDKTQAVDAIRKHFDFVIENVG
ncbi:MAG: FadR/GntR family transcriptional regulator [Victivallaceae bacterium]|nr:FadR/GntR family transcriptional regulator [Victivallaceae bacterium]